MQIDIQGRPSFGLAVVQLDPGDSISAEAGAMVAMSHDLHVHTGFMGGRRGIMRWMWAAFVGIMRRFLAGESLFVNTFQATTRSGNVLLAPVMVGDVERLTLDGEHRVYVQAEYYLASTEDVFVSVRWGGLSMWLGGEGAFFLSCGGTGDLLINAYGAIEKVEVNGSYIIDNGHVVAWSGDLTYMLEPAGNMFSTMFSGEGWVLRFEGRGTVWMQTRDLPALIDWVKPYLPK
ncbi:MAG: TIGR00266 family protein [Myxococcales bacterium]|nr:TIGR00266 family protein [Myxococcales bacterium]